MDSSASTALVVRSVPLEEEEEEEEGGKRMTKELSEDGILEILTRLPPNSLLRFRFVSKHWYSLILSPNFIALHYSHSRNKKVSLLPHFHENKLCFWFGDVKDKLKFPGYLHCNTEMLGCCNGVICLSITERPHSYILWNPATRQQRMLFDGAPMELPDLDFFKRGGWYGSGFCFDQVTNAFKVAQIRLNVTEAGETKSQVNVFSTATNSWTQKNVPLPNRVLLSCFSFINCITFVNGYIHWYIKLRRDNGTFEDMYVLSYNMTDEVFQRIELPFRGHMVYCQLAQYNEALAMFVHKRTGSHDYFKEVDVWVLNDCGGANHSWSKLLTCKLPIKVNRSLGFFKKDGLDLVLFFSEWDTCFYLYDPEAGTAQKFYNNDWGTHAFLYSESLASLY